MKIFRKLFKGFVLLLLAALFAGWIAVTNMGYTVRNYTVKSDRLPPSFDGFVIAQISDLHSRELGSLAADIEAGEPDVILISGDLVSRRDRELPGELVSDLVRIAPVYYSPGNHEADNERYPEMRDALRALGVTVLEGESVTLERTTEDGEAQYIRIAGIADPAAVTGDDPADGEVRDAVDAALCTTVDGSDAFTVLISHRPEYMILYEAHSVDVVFSGHAHGGALRLPFIGAVWAPGQGFFPAYDGGLYESEYAAMVVSRGLGKSKEPFRVNCSYELVFCTLKQS